MNESPEISFVVVNYNGIIHTTELIHSMELNLKALSYEVVVIDNGSLVDEAALLSAKFPQHIIIRNNINLGFSGGNNLGLKASSGKYIMLINNDTIIPDNSVYKLIEMMKGDPSIGAVSPKIYFMKPPKTIQFAGFTEFTKITIRNRTIGYNELDKGQYNIPSETASTHGAAMMIRREIINKIGFMPEIYFLYYEEHDWCSRMKEFGYKLIYQPAAIVIHKDSQSTGSDSYLKIYYITRNRLLFAYRNRRGIVRVLSIVYQILLANPKQLLIFLVKGERNQALAIFNGSKDFFWLKNKNRN